MNSDLKKHLATMRAKLAELEAMSEPAADTDFGKTDSLINACLEAGHACVQAAEEAGAQMVIAVEEAKKAEAQAEIAAIFRAAEAGLARSAGNYRDWEEKYRKKGQLFEPGGMG
jgi:Zn-dependent alcohol dehydrogenase